LTSVQKPAGPRPKRLVFPDARRAAAGALLFVLSSCAHAVQQAPGGPDPVRRRAAASSVVLCRTTEAELRARLGQPTRDGTFRRDRLLTWIISEDDVVSYLGVLVDSRGIVVDLVWDVPSEVPWTPQNQCGNQP
jgi:hypothetical protein